MKAVKSTEPVSKNRVILINGVAWTVCLAAIVAAVSTWAHNRGFSFSGHQSIYQIFPILGLVAYSIMWSHYIASAIRRLLGLPASSLKTYFSSTRFVVLACICLHPGLLIYQRFRDGYGLPPGSYERYVAPGLGWVTLLGTASLLVFLAYEFGFLFSKRSWWKYVVYAGDAAMLAIFYHGLRLGTDLQFGWFMKVWWFYGLTLVAALIYSYVGRYRNHKMNAK